MDIKNKKASKTLAVLFIIIMLIVCLFWLNNGKGNVSFRNNANFQQLQTAYSYGYDITGRHYKPNNDDPQLGYSLDKENVESVLVQFSQPLSASAAIQVYYAGAGEQLSEKRVVHLNAASGTDSFVVDLPGGVYNSLRVDINGEFDLESVQICDVDPTVYKNGDEFLRLGFEIALLLLVFIYLWNRYIRYAGDETANERLAKTRRCEKLNTTERWYVFFCFTVCFVWSCIFLSQSYGPDEYMRYEVPRYIYETGKLPYGGEPSLINPIWGTSYGFSIMLPYITSALFMRIASLYVSSSFPILIAARMSSTLSYAGIAYFAIRIGKRKFSDAGKWVFAFLMTLTPQLVFLGSYVNLDSFALLTVMIIIDCWLECLAYEFDRRSCVRLAIALGLCLLSYKFAYSYGLASILLYCFWFLRNHKRTSFVTFFKNSLIMIGVVFLIAGWHFIRNSILYGDFLARNASTPYVEQYALPQYKPGVRATYRSSGYTILYMLKSTEWIKMTLRSTVSVLGYLNVFAANWVYRGFALLYSAGGFLALIQLIVNRLRRSAVKTGVFNFFVLIASLITIGLSIYYSWSTDYQAQGRYVIYALPCCALFAASGYDWLIGQIKQRSAFGEPVYDIVKGFIALFLSAALFESFIHCISVFL